LGHSSQSKQLFYINIGTEITSISKNPFSPVQPQQGRKTGVFLCVSVCRYGYGYGYSRDGVNHIETHFDGTMGVIRTGFWESGDAVVTIAQQLNAQTMMLRSQSIKAAMEVEKWKRRSWKMDRKI